MRVIIVGAGEVGRSIAEDLMETHEVVVIERDEELVEDLTYSLDALVLHGDGTDLGTLEEAGLGEAELLIASTDGDETNIVICGTAKAGSEVFTISRVKRHNLLATWQRTEKAFNVDFMVSSDLLTAEAIYRISGLPGAHDANTFIGGIVRMAEFEVGEKSPVAAQTIREADRYDSLTFAAVFRDDELIIPRGETVLRPNDRVVVIGSPDSVTQFAADIARTANGEIGQVVIVGGSEIGFQTARVFEEHGHRPQLIERDRQRAREIAEKLPNTSVWESDATDMEFLKREHLDESNIVIAALESDEKNLLVSMLAKRIGVERTVAIIESVEYADLFEKVGVDVAISPREETAEEIIRFTREARTEKIAMVEHDLAEVLEIEIGDESRLARRSIADITDDLPDGVVIGAISRNGELVTPRGGTTLQPGDRVVLFVDTRVLDRVTEYL